MSDFVLDASLALRWFLEDETDREYSLKVLDSLGDKRAAVTLLWFFEIGNGLLMAHRRKRITVEQIGAFLKRLEALPIEVSAQTPAEILILTALAREQSLTVYDSAYLALAKQLSLPLATADLDLRKAASTLGINLV